ncbi:hypothetical protein SAMN02745194_02377 [Roseomonas rosea]|uniref:FecR family protein n=1 Tax=Muricoccus roseus TaxID=198092 RepID=A0A1M6ILF8_9PROT|nr:hypothetical protein [Roseomonas rosea]SHJ35264.1 hypothetical protein SAMN02745194_02377 [Roseomonas rosea]
MSQPGGTPHRRILAARPALVLGMAMAAALPALALTPVEAPQQLLLPVQGGQAKSPAPPSGGGGGSAPRPPQPPAPAFALSAADAARTPPLQPDRPVQVTLRRGQQAFFRVAPEAGEAWSVVTRRLGRNTDTVLAALDEAGAVVTEDDDGGSENLASRIEVQPGDGVRVVRAGTLDSSPGRFELVLTREQPMPPPDFATTQAEAAQRPPLALGQPVRVRLRRSQQAFFALPEDRTDVIALTRDLSQSTDTVLALLDAEGRVLAENDDGGQGLASILSIAGTTGPVTLRASLISGGTGSFEVMLEREAPAPTPDYPTNLEEARARGPLAPGQNVHIALGRGRQAIFALPEGQPLTIATRNLQDEADTVLALLDAQGEMITEDDDGGGGLASRIRTADGGRPAAFVRATLLNGARGEFDLVVQGSAAPAQGGAPAADLEEARRRPSLILGEAVRVQLSAGQEAYFALPHDGRESLAMTFALGRDTDTEIALLDESGEVLAENDDAEGFASRLNIPASPRPAFLRAKLLSGAGAFNLVLVRPAP